MKTKFLSKEEAQSSRKWHVVDAAGIPLGRLASEVAILLRGKHKPEFTRHVDCGDFVIVVNAEKVVLTGNKKNQKLYQWHTGYIGGVKTVSASDMLEKNPEKVIEKAVKRMFYKGALTHNLVDKLKVYAGSEHPHTAQQPAAYKVGQYFNNAAA